MRGGEQQQEHARDEHTNHYSTQVPYQILLLFQSPWNCNLVFFLGNVMKTLRYSIKSDWERVMVALYFFSP